MVHTSFFKDKLLAIMIWNFFNVQLQHQIISLNNELNALFASGERSYQASGPDIASTEASYIETSVYVWKNASAQMANLARSNGAVYIHVLQPNQYVPNQKIFSDEERTIAQVNTGLPAIEVASLWAYKRGVESGYPLLVKSGNELIKKGVNFVDLTGIFKYMSETIYRDACCHYNQKGYDMLARTIVQRIQTGQ